MRAVVKPAVLDLRLRHRAVGQDPTRLARACWRDLASRSNPGENASDAQAQGAENTKSALTTYMRKLQIIANVMFRNKMPWQTPALAAFTATSPLIGAVPEHGCC